MKFSEISLKDACVVETTPLRDDRGAFSRLFCIDELEDMVKGDSIKQINHSLTACKGSIRGMHFQHPPKAEAKMVRCIRGSVFDVMIDLRKNSKTFLQWHGEILSAENMKMLYVPKGFAHGFQTLEKDCEMLYLHTEFYSPLHEEGICYDDPSIGIQWPLEVADISEKDKCFDVLTPDFAGIIL